MSLIKIGTRGSKLALYQAKLVASALKDLGYESKIVKILTSGDADQRDFKKILGDGFFTRAIERALTTGEADLAIHSAKDLPSLQHRDLPWVAFSNRESAKDYFIHKKNCQDFKVIGSSSPRRQSQIKALYPKSDIKPLRGNIDTRIEKLISGQYDAILLAKAGVDRLDLKSIFANELNFQTLNFPTAPTQGILALQTTTEKSHLLKQLANYDLDKIARKEKEVLRFLGGGCHLAIAANAETGDFEFFRDEKVFSFRSKKQSYLQHICNSVSENNFPPQVLLTHSIQHHEKVYRLFSKQRIGCLSYPLFKIKTIFNENDWQKDFYNLDYIFTSPNGVRIFFQEAFARDILIKNLQQRKFYCVGEATAKQLQHYGCQTETLPEIATADSLSKIVPQNDKTLFCGNPEGAFVNYYKGQTFALYKSVPHDDTWDLPKENFQHIIFSSPLSVQYAINGPLAPYLKEKKLYAFGPSSAKALENYQLSYTQNPISGNWQSMVDCVRNKIKDL